ncbi:tyrosine-protein kinase-like otk [Culicoides brevitarsis]|uniref:tyrosine-protein kinase-like otk n=1 Tax=Culicoides brevitarsis TaxID=469753 RepID=UPI00307C411C
MPNEKPNHGISHTGDSPFANSQFLVTPENQKVIEGDSVIFRCKAENNNDDLTYIWTLNGNPLETSDRVYQNGSNLHIQVVNKTQDVGEYACIAYSKSTGARETTSEARLDVIWLAPPVVQLISADKHLNNYVLKCHVEGHGDIVISWFKDEEILERSGHIDWQKRHLFIRDATPMENGVYACAATNEAGSIVSTKNYKLKLKDVKQKKHILEHLLAHHKLFECSPSNPKLCRGKRDEAHKPATNIEFLRHPHDVVGKEGEHTVLNCLFKVTDGSENTQTVKWRKDGSVIRHAAMRGGNVEANIPDNIYAKEHARIQINKENASLVISSLLPNDAGLYECLVLNEDGSEAVSKAGHLKVIARLKFSPKPTAKTLELNSIGKVHCKAQGTPSPTIRWVFGEDSPLPSHATSENGTLVFDKVRFDDKGNYTCIASNAEQGEIRASVAITVAVAPQFVIKPEPTVVVAEMGNTSLHCQPTGDPLPTVQWDKDLKTIHNDEFDDRFRILENGTLIITEAHLDDDGKYGCTIGNMAGFKREEVHLMVKPGYLPSGNLEDGFVITRAVMVTMGVAATYIILVVVLMVWCRRRRNARKMKLGDMKDMCELEGEIKTAETEPCLPIEKERTPNGVHKKSPNGKLKASGEPEKSDDTVNSNKSKKSTSSSVLDNYAIQRSALLDLILIGKGEFGDVLIGKAKRSDLKTTTNVKEKEEPSVEIENEKEKQQKDDATEYRYVMVKSLTKVKDEHAITEFRRQIDLFRTVSSRGVARLYGLCREKDPHYLTLEYTDWGDLKQFLLATSDEISTTKLETKPIPLNVLQCCGLAHMLAKGCDAIYKAKLIHK